jgi:hypothetical protein
MKLLTLSLLFAGSMFAQAPTLTIQLGNLSSTSLIHQILPEVQPMVEVFIYDTAATDVAYTILLSYTGMVDGLPHTASMTVAAATYNGHLVTAAIFPVDAIKPSVQVYAQSYTGATATAAVN